MFSHKRKIVLLLLFCILVSVVFITSADMHTAYGAVWGGNCPQSGSVVEIGFVGCSACGGSGRRWIPGTGAGSGDTMRVGNGMNSYTSIDGTVKKVEYYVCYNCGVVPKKSRLIKTEVYTKVGESWVHRGTIDGGYASSCGYVPQRWCSACGPQLKADEDTWLGREASYTVYHISVDLIEPEDTKFSVTVNYGEGGIAYPAKTEYSPEEQVMIYADSDEMHSFGHWTIDEGGNLEGFDIYSAATGFSMPERDVTITAWFNVKPTPPPVTPKPDVTPKPTVTPMAKPTATPIPTATPAPYFPEEDIRIEDSHIRYFSTDKGYTMQALVDDYGNKLADESSSDGSAMLGNHNTNSAYGDYFLIGRDDYGNEWYFEAGWKEAYYVHPYRYNGNYVNETTVKNITSLVFPETIYYYNRNTYETEIYTVKSIGGGLRTYGDYNSSVSGAYYQREKSTPSRDGVSYGWTESVNEGGYYMHKNVSCSQAALYGVVGNGYMISTGKSYATYRQSSHYQIAHENYETKSDYYVYNTTLTSITIPQSVIKIEEGAFIYCQALVEIKGGEGILEIGENSFQGADVLNWRLSSSDYKTDNDYRNFYFYYNRGYAFFEPTTEMVDWKQSVAWKKRCSTPTFPVVRTIARDAFAYRKNMRDVRIDSDSVEIFGDAFSYCDLDSVTIMGEKARITDAGVNDLGTKGTKERTIIYTIPNSNAMFYGLTHNNYYEVRAGYDVTYHNNFLPEETYMITSTVDKTTEKVKTTTTITSTQQEDYGFNGDTSYPKITEERSLTVSVNEEGVLFPKITVPDVKFVRVETISGYSQNSPGEEYIEKIFAVATAEDGRMFISSAGSAWQDLGIPAGSTSHQWCVDRYTFSWQSASMYGGGSGNEQHTMTVIFYLYKGSLYRKNVLLQSIVTGAKGQGTTVSVPISEPERVVMPQGVIFADFSVSGGNSNCISNAINTDYVQDNTKTYNKNFVSVYGTDIHGRHWLGTCSKTGDVSLDPIEFEKNSFYVPEYTWVQTGSYRQVFEARPIPTHKEYEYTMVDVLTVIDEKGDLVLIKGTTDAGTSPVGRGVAVTIMAGKDFVSAEKHGQYYLLKDSSGGVWVYYYQCPVASVRLRDNYYNAEVVDVSYTVPKKVFEGEKILEIWEFNEMEHNSDLDYENQLFVVSRGTLVVQTENKKNYKILTEGTQKSSSETVITLLDTYSAGVFSGYDYNTVVASNMFENEGHLLLWWNDHADGTGRTYYPGNRISLVAPVDLYAQWDGEKTIVRYSPNGGVGYMEEEEYPLEQKEVVLKKNTFTKKGYEFIGWSRESIGNEPLYSDESVVIVEPGKINCYYAQWKKIESYIIQVSKNDSNVRPVELDESKTRVLRSDEIYTIPDGYDKPFKISYDLQGKGIKTGTSTPKVTLTAENTDGYLLFVGWLLFEKKGAEYDFTGKRYNAGAKVSGLGTKNESVMTLFPYYSGEAATVLLPLPACVGYRFIGWGKTMNESDQGRLFHIEEDVEPIYKPSGSETLYAHWEAKTYGVSLVAEHLRAEEGDITTTQTSVVMTYDKELPNVRIPQSERFIFMGYYDRLDNDGVPTADAIQFYDESGKAVIDEATGKTVTWTRDDDVTVLYAYFVYEIEVSLDGRGATEQEQTTVTRTYEEFGPNVIPPKKTGYSFGGYYTGTRGTGKKYYNAAGESVAVWTELRTDILYAYWIQNEVELPKKDDTEVPEVAPEERMEVEVALDTSVVQIYADDNNPDTDAETDVPPYQVADVVRDSRLEAAGGIPSTEKVAVRAKMGSWLLSCLLERKSGIDMVCVRVTVPYRTQYEEPEDESLIISEIQYETVKVMVPKGWSYWILAEGGIYFPEEVVVRNSALESGRVEIPVRWSGDGVTQKPGYSLVVYGEKDQHIRWSSYDENGCPVIDLMLSETEYIVSEVPGEKPNVEEYLENVCYNAAWSDTTQFSVRSDCVAIDGIVLLSDLEGYAGVGKTPDRTVLTELKGRIEDTTYSQTYADGIALVATASNGRFDTEADLIYTAGETNVGNETRKQVLAKGVNEINIHTPVVCLPTIWAEHESMYQCEEIPEGHTVLVLDEEGIHSDFILQIGNEGYHSDKKGYGERDYVRYLAKREGMVQNEVCFPIPIWLDTENDREKENDVLLEANVWYVLGDEKQRFYVPPDTWEGSYEIKFRSVAINGKGNEDKAELRSNAQPAHYVAEGNVQVYLTGRLFGFTVNKVNGTIAWKDVTEPVSYSVGVQHDSDSLWRTLPLRIGVHPLYRNVGGLPMGGSMEFHVTSIGKSFDKDAVVKIVPQLVACYEDGYKNVDVYYESAEENGVFLRKWNEEECTFLLEESQEIRAAIRRWSGTFTLPERLYVTEEGTNVKGYQERYGLSFTEEFWMKDIPLMLRFALEIENLCGERLYYGMIPEMIANNIWKTETKATYREDIDGKRFEISGGEVAVLYPGDSARVEDITYGIY